MVGADTNVACGCALAAHIGNDRRLELHHADKAALAVERGSAGEAELRRWVHRLAPGLRRHGRDRAAAALALGIRDAEEREVRTFGSVAAERRRHEIGRAIDPQ
jgi:hypothetical protein